MATITELVVAASVEPSGVKRGFDQALGYSKQFARDLDTVVRQSGKVSGAAAGADLAEAMVASLKENFESRKGYLREQLARGVISREEFQRSAGEAAQGFNAALLAGISRLAEKGILPDDLRTRMVAELREDGIRAGEAYAESLRAGSESELSALAGSIKTRMSSIGVGLALAIEGALENNSEGGFRRVTRSLATLGFMLGPEGAIVSGAAIAGQAIFDHFTHAQEAIEKASQDTDRLIDRLYETPSLMASGTALRQFYSGDAHYDTNGPFADVIRNQGGIRGLEGRRAALEAQLTPAVQPQDLSDTEGFARYQKIIADNDKIYEQLAKIDQQLSPMRAKYKEIQGAFGEAVTLEVGRAQANVAKQQARADRKTTTPPGEVVGDEAIKQLERFQALAQEVLGRPVAATEAARGALAQLLEEQKRVNDEIAKEGGEQTANLRLIEAQKRIADEIRRMNTTPIPASVAAHVGVGGPLSNVVVPQSNTPVEDNIAKVTQEAVAAKAAADAFRELGLADADSAQKAAAARDRAVTAIKAYAAEAKAMYEQTNDPKYLAMLAEMDRALHELGVTATTTKTSFDDLLVGIRGVVEAVQGLGLGSEALTRMVSSATSLIQALRAVQAAEKAAGGGFSKLSTMSQISLGLGIVGASVGALSALGSLTGVTEDNKLAEEHNRILEQNNERLGQLSEAVQGMTGGLDERLRALTVLRDISPLLQDLGRASGNHNADRAGIAAALQAGGFTADQLKALAQQYGIQLYDSKGQLVVGAFDQLAKALEEATKAATTFSNTFEDQSALATLHDKVFGKTSDVDAITRELALLKQFAPELAANFQGLDASTKEGRAAIESALQSLVTELEQQKITAEMLGDLTGAKQLAEIISTIQDSLDSLAKAANTTADALLNVPTGYKTMLANQRFLAQDVGRSITTSSITPPRFVPQGSGPQITTQATYVDQGVTVNGDIYIDAQQESGDDLFAKVLRAAQRKANVQLGDSTRWSQLQTA